MHVPVLVEEVVRVLDPKPNEHVVDGTLGGGGHAAVLLEKTGPKGRLLGIDRDPEALKRAKARIPKALQERATFVEGNFADLREILQEMKFPPFSLLLLDLGWSSDQLESGRGFSFQKDEPLDMRYGPDEFLSAEKLVNYGSRRELEEILKTYGEEQFASLIARTIVEERARKPLHTTKDLRELVWRVVPSWYRRLKIHPATKTFQALRIAVNRELPSLEKGLEQAAQALAPGGRMAVISFHSLEDRIVKNTFRNNPELEIITKKPIEATEAEVRKNPRARSAKLRAAKKQS